MSDVEIWVDLNIADLLRHTTDDNRVKLVKLVLQDIQEEGTIDVLRKIVNDPKFNDEEE